MKQPTIWSRAKDEEGRGFSAEQRKKLAELERKKLHNPPGMPAWALFVIGMVLLLFFFGIVLGAFRLDDARGQVTARAESHYRQLSTMPWTKTPAATASPVPSRTPWPSHTPIETGTAAPVVQYIEITRVVEVTRVTVITATPAPHTPTDTPDPTATAVPTATEIPIEIQQALHDAEIAMRREQIGIRLAEWLLSPGTIKAVVIGFILLFGIRITVRWNTNKPTLKKTIESWGTIEKRAREHSTDGLEDILALLDESASLYGPGERTLAGWREMNDVDERWTGDLWTRVVKDMEAIGLRTIRQSGVGSYLRDNTIRAARLFVLRIMAIPPHPNAESGL